MENRTDVLPETARDVGWSQAIEPRAGTEHHTVRPSEALCPRQTRDRFSGCTVRVGGEGAPGDDGSGGRGSGRMRAVAEAVHTERRFPRGEQSSVEVWEERMMEGGMCA